MSTVTTLHAASSRGPTRSSLHPSRGGLTNQQIADRFGVSLKTVQNHVATVLAKLHVVGRAQAALRAREAGLG